MPCESNIWIATLSKVLRFKKIMLKSHCYCFHSHRGLMKKRWEPRAALSELLYRAERRQMHFRTTSHLTHAVVWVLFFLFLYHFFFVDKTTPKFTASRKQSFYLLIILQSGLGSARQYFCSYCWWLLTWMLSVGTQKTASSRILGWLGFSFHVISRPLSFPNGLYRKVARFLTWRFECLKNTKAKATWPS